VAFSTTIVVGSFVLPAIIAGDDEVTDIGVVEPAPPGLETALAASATRFDQEIEISTYPSPTSADDALTDGAVDVVVELPADLGGPGEVRFEKEPNPSVAQLITSATVGLRVQAVIAASDVDQAALAAAQQPPTVASVDGQPEVDRSRFVVANIGAVAILIGIFGFGFAVLTGVVEEKQSRVVEVVLSTVRARDLLMGKVLGIGVLGIVQLAVFMVAALVAISLTRQFELPATTPAAIALLVIWFILGYTLYSTALGFLGALASRAEEASNAATPVSVIAMVSYFVAIVSVLDDPSGTVATIATFVPPSAPFVIPLRAAYDAIPLWQIGVSIVITLVAIWLLFGVGARIYSGAVLQVGGRIKLRDAWRSSDR
jgi:ABC-2 type transport system permease protein